jgi:phage protein U
VTFRKVPLTISGNSKEERVEFTAASTWEKTGAPILSVSSNTLQLHGTTILRGNANTRGRETIRGDGKATAFTIAFPRVYDEAPVVTYSISDFAASRLGKTEASGFVVEFATAPPAGREIAVSWIAQR